LLELLRSLAGDEESAAKVSNSFKYILLYNSFFEETEKY